MGPSRRGNLPLVIPIYWLEKCIVKVKYIGYEIISVLRKFQSVETFDTPREIPRDSSVHVQVEAVKAGMLPER